MKILVTGSSGFVGRATTSVLDAAGHTVFGYDLQTGQDIRNRKQLSEYLRGMDAVLHLAAVSRFVDADADPMTALETNVIGTGNVGEIAKKLNVPVVYASTGSVYMPITQEPPITEDFPAVGNSMYACTKYLGELMLRSAKCQWLILRYAHLYGADKGPNGLVGSFLDRISRGLQPILYGGQQSNDFTYVKDVAMANLLALIAPAEAYGQVYNIGTGEELSAEAAGLQILEAWGLQTEMLRAESRTVDPARFVYDVSKAADRLGFRAGYSFALGLEDMRALAS